MAPPSNLLIFGRTGQVARELARLAPDAIFLGREAADLSSPKSCAAAIRDRLPFAVINAAAWTAVDKAETEKAIAQVVNADAPGAMARACAELGVPFVHISTDYVFDGEGVIPWKPSDTAAPQNAYGCTKHAGEEQVAKAGGPHAILRTSWVFSAHGANFVKTMLRLAAARDRLAVVADQIGGPTPASDIARTCLVLAEGLATDPTKFGIYHLSGTPDISWAGFAREIFAQVGMAVTVEDILTSAFPTPAKRPANSRMDCSALATFGLSRPNWRTGLTTVLKELGALK